jgi:hypothetical protein
VRRCAQRGLLTGSQPGSDDRIEEPNGDPHGQGIGAAFGTLPPEAADQTERDYTQHMSAYGASAQLIARLRPVGQTWPPVWRIVRTRNRQHCC